MFGISSSQGCRGRIPGLVIIVIITAIIIINIIKLLWLFSSTAARSLKMLVFDRPSFSPLTLAFCSSVHHIASPFQLDTSA